MLNKFKFLVEICPYLLIETNFSLCIHRYEAVSVSDVTFRFNRKLFYKIHIV